jgi:hypothetical protein
LSAAWAKWRPWHRAAMSRHPHCLPSRKGRGHPAVHPRSDGQAQARRFAEADDASERGRPVVAPRAQAPGPVKLPAVKCKAAGIFHGASRQEKIRYAREGAPRRYGLSGRRALTRKSSLSLSVCNRGVITPSGSGNRDVTRDNQHQVSVNFGNTMIAPSRFAIYCCSFRAALNKFRQARVWENGGGSNWTKQR